ncbi:MAG: hypothetical protein EBS05_15330 [Proteobacteria bacterium]|nr:hypothetical protein [Pseudomonadota bacterium]
MQKNPNLVAILALLATVGALAFLYFTQFAGPPKANLKPFEMLGEMVATETAKLLGGSGSVVVVMESFDQVVSKSAEPQLKGFKAGLAKAKGVTLKGVEYYKHAEGEDVSRWPAGLAAKLAAMGQGASATVLFVALPQSLSAEEIAALKSSTSKLVLVGGAVPLVKPMLTQGVFQIAIVNRFPPKPAPKSETAAEWFNRAYLVATPTAISELP